MNRRSFLGALAAVLAAPKALLRACEPVRVPRGIERWDVSVLWGDGVHDDTNALQAWLDGLPVYWPNGRRIYRNDPITGKRFRTTRTVFVQSPSDGALAQIHLAHEPNGRFVPVATRWTL